jgi:hypothetical protein
MTDTVSKMNFGLIIGPNNLAVTKINFGVAFGPPGGMVVTKMNFGVVYDPNTPGPGASTRRRQITVC